MNVDTCICPPTGAMSSALNGSINVNGDASFANNYAQERGGGNLPGMPYYIISMPRLWPHLVFRYVHLKGTATHRPCVVAGVSAVLKSSITMTPTAPTWIALDRTCIVLTSSRAFVFDKWVFGPPASLNDTLRIVSGIDRSDSYATFVWVGFWSREFSVRAAARDTFS